MSHDFLSLSTLVIKLNYKTILLKFSSGGIDMGCAFRSFISERSTTGYVTLTGLFMSALTVGSTAFAQIGRGGGEIVGTDGIDPFTNVINVVCNTAQWLQGPVGIAIGFLVLVAGIIAMQVASRDALPMMGRAVVGTALLVGAGTAFGAIVTPSGCPNGSATLPPIRVTTIAMEAPAQFELTTQLDSLV